MPSPILARLSRSVHAALCMLPPLLAGEVSSAEREIAILVAGDALASYDLKVVRSWVESLHEGLPERGFTFRVELVELGADVPLEVARERFDRRLRALEPQIVVLAFGGDASRGEADLAARLRALGTRAEASDAHVLVVTAPRGGPADVAECVREAASDVGAYVLDAAELSADADALPKVWRREDGGLSADGHLALVRLVRRRIVELRASNALDTRSVAYPVLDGTSDIVCVVDGVLRDARDPRAAFRTERGALAGQGWIEAASALGEGDFRIELELALEKLDGTEAGLELGGLYLGFDGPGGRFFLDGPLAGPERVLLEPHRAHFGAGGWITMEVLRASGELRWRIGKRTIAALRAPAALAPVRLDSGKGALRLRSFRVRGALLEQPALPAAKLSIPQVDLNDAKELRVVVDRETGQYLGHVTMAKLAGGNTLLATYPKGHGRGAIVMKRSTDGGLTWSERLPLPPSWETSREVPTLYHLGGEAGAERLILFSGLHPIRCAQSADSGTSWSELEAIGDYGGIVAMASLERLHDGSLAAWFHDDGRYLGKERGPARFRVFQVRSRDEGHTWSQPQPILEAPRADYCEPGSVRSPDGETLALLLRENSRTRFSAIVTSRDEGRTWSAPRDLPASLMGDRHTLRTLADGRIFASFRDTGFDSPSQGDWVGWIGSFDDLVNAREGACRVRFLDNTHRWDGAYPGVEVLPDGTIVAVTYGHWSAGEEPYIVAVRVHPRELERRARMQ